MVTGKSNTRENRLFFIDNLRWVMITLVVLIHTSVTYSGIGGWYYIENKSIDTVSTVVFGMFNTFTQAYFMGFMFLIAGYFVPSSYDRKGLIKFINDKSFRLGIPVLIYIFIINPFILYYLLGTNSETPFMQFYAHYIISTDFIGGTGPLWFALALLIFSIVYALFSRAGIKPFKSVVNKGFPRNFHIVLVILLISLLNFIVRIFLPFGTSIYNMQLCFFSQYIVLFILGIAAYRKNWLMNIRSSFGTSWLKLSLGLGLIVWLLLMIFGGPLSGQEYVILGGLYWQSAVYSLWEQLVCAGVILGFIIVFRDKYNFHGRLSSFLSDNAFGVYVFHAPILISISLLLKGVNIHPIAKFVLIAVIVVPAAFIFSSMIRKVPIFRKIFS